MNKSGLIFNIQRYSIHDGPGIRTTVFLKGCPLRCKWCSNPESMQPYPEIMVRDINCVKCFKCVESCPVGAITRVGDTREINRQTCSLCGECVKACPSGALALVGKYMNVAEVMDAIEKDRLFYLNSGGGVTFSGGEPLIQAEFVGEVFRLCKQRGIHTTLDTTGYSPWPVLKNVLGYTDLVLYDIKHLDPAEHEKGTGCGNELILDNLSKTIEMVATWLRIPVIPNFNDSVLYMENVAKFIAKLPRGQIEKISILPYHNWGEQKYESLGLKYAFRETLVPSEEHIHRLMEILESCGIDVSVGG